MAEGSTVTVRLEL